MLGQKPRHEVALGDVHFFLEGVTGDLDDLEAVPQRPWDVPKPVRRADKHY